MNWPPKRDAKVDLSSISKIEQKTHAMRDTVKKPNIRLKCFEKRITLTRAKTVVFLFVSCAHFPCVCTHTTVCIAWLYINPPTEEGPSPKHLGFLTKFDTFRSILALRLAHTMQLVSVTSRRDQLQGLVATYELCILEETAILKVPFNI